MVKEVLVLGTGFADTVARDTEGNDMLAEHARSARVTESAGRLTKLAFEVVANIAAVLILFQVYKLARRTFIQRGETLGYDHAYSVIDFERRLHLFFEVDLQKWVLGSTRMDQGV